MMKKVMSLLLALLLCLSTLLFTACGIQNDGTKPAATTPAETTSPEEKRVEDVRNLNAALKNLSQLSGVTLTGTAKLVKELGASIGGKVTTTGETMDMSFSGGWLLTVTDPKASLTVNMTDQEDDKAPETANVYFYFADGALYGYNDVPDTEEPYVELSLSDLTKGMDKSTIASYGPQIDGILQEIVDLAVLHGPAVDNLLKDTGYTAGTFLAETELLVKLCAKVMSYAGYTSTVTVPAHTGTVSPVLGHFITVTQTEAGYEFSVDIATYLDQFLAVLDELKPLLTKPLGESIDSLAGAGTVKALTDLLDSVKGTDTVGDLLTRIDTEMKANDLMSLDQIYAFAAKIMGKLAIPDMPTTADGIKELLADYMPATVDTLVQQLTGEKTMTYEVMIGMLKSYLNQTPEQIYAGAAPEGKTLTGMFDELRANVAEVLENIAFQAVMLCDADMNIKSVTLAGKARFTRKIFSDDAAGEDYQTNLLSFEFSVTLTVSDNVTVAPAPELQAQITENNKVKVN